jgi:hypothetical protein
MWECVWRVRMHTRRGSRTLHLQSLVNLLASTIMFLLGCFQQVSVPAEKWHNKGMLVLSTAAVVLHAPGKPGETWTPLERELVFHSDVFNRRLRFIKWVGTSAPEQPDAVKRRPRL